MLRLTAVAEAVAVELAELGAPGNRDAWLAGVRAVLRLEGVGCTLPEVSRITLAGDWAA